MPGEEQESARQDAWFQALFQDAPDALLLHEDGTIVTANPVACKLLGYEAKELKGTNALDLVDGASRSDIAARMKEPDTGPFDAILQRKDGESLAVRARGRAVTIDGKVVRVVSFAPKQPDSKEMDQLREEIVAREEVRRLQETNQFKTQILNTTAHELNTPLTPVRLQLHLLKSGALGQIAERQQKAVDIIARNVERLSFLVNDILDVARLESGRMEVSRQPVRVGDILAESVESFEETARRVGVSLSLEGPMDIKVDADPERLTQVVYNLVGNALKFTPEGGRVVVGSHIDGDDVAIRIDDTGPGLTPDQIDQLFQPFSRVHDTQQSTIAGTGLGLFICKGIVDAHDGTIRVESDGPGQGSTFTVLFPLASGGETLPDAKLRRHRPRPMDPLAQRLRELI